MNCDRLRILVVDDEENIRFALSMCLESVGHTVVTQGTIAGALAETKRQAFDLIFLDVRLGNDNGLDYIQPILQQNPWTRIVVITAYASISTAVDAMKLGAADYLPKPFEHAQLLLLTEKVAERRRLERKMDALQRTLGAMDPEWDFPTSSPLLQSALELARRVATSNAAILICGEAGTGRGRLARAIHAWSSRSNGPFVCFVSQGTSIDIETNLFGVGNVGAGNVVGSELGGESGGGGQANLPAIALAHGGTLLLEEVGETSLQLQPRLLALLRDKEFEHVDAPGRRPIDVRLIATTTTNLEDRVKAGRFRADLLNTLDVVRIDVPPLRQRASDIPLLASRYLAHFALENHRRVIGFTNDAMFVLIHYPWPGNSRELRNVIERAVLISDTESIGARQFPAQMLNEIKQHNRSEHNLDDAHAQVADDCARLDGFAVGDLVTMDQIEETHIKRVLASAGTIRRTASILDVSPRTLMRKLKQYRFAGDRIAERSVDQPEK